MANERHKWVRARLRGEPLQVCKSEHRVSTPARTAPFDGRPFSTSVLGNLGEFDTNRDHLEEGTSLEELSPSEWPIDKTVGHFLDW